MTQAIKAIETSYKGYRFRSRLEARWAVFFDTLEIKWEYEREGYELPSGRYLPDFFLHWSNEVSPRLAQFREVGYWVEIKGVDPTTQELALLGELSRATGHIGYLLAGNVGDQSVWVSDLKGRVHAWPLAKGKVEWLAFASYCNRGYAHPLDGVEDARSARFEHGEKGSAK